MMIKKGATNGGSEERGCTEPGPRRVPVLREWCKASFEGWGLHTADLHPGSARPLLFSGARSRWGAGKYLLPSWEWYFQKLWNSIDAIRYSKVLSLPLAKFT